MAGEIPAYVVGNLTADPELRFTPGGKAVATFTVVQNKRIRDGEGWTDGEPTFVRCTVWEGMAENVAESLTKGMNVVVAGGLSTDAWTDREGNKRTTLVMDRVDAVGPSLRRATAQVTRVDAQREVSRAVGGDPWATHPMAPEGGFEEKPPF
jgi:single-strand DNA-binding protein